MAAIRSRCCDEASQGQVPDDVAFDLKVMKHFKGKFPTLYSRLQWAHQEGCVPGPRLTSYVASAFERMVDEGTTGEEATPKATKAPQPVPAMAMVLAEVEQKVAVVCFRCDSSESTKRDRYGNRVFHQVQGSATCHKCYQQMVREKKRGLSSCTDKI